MTEDDETLLDDVAGAGASLFFMGGSCSCPLPGPCFCGAVLE